MYLRIITVFLIALLLPMVAHSSESESESDKKILKIVVGFPPGAAVDRVARYLQKRFENDKMPAIVTYLSGADGIIATRAVVASKPNGTTIFVSPTAGLLLASALDSQIDQMVMQLDPAITIGKFTKVFITKKSNPIQNWNQLMSHIKNKNVNVGGLRNNVMIANEVFGKNNRVTTINYVGDINTVNDILNGSLDVGVVSYASAAGLIASNMVTAIAVTNDRAFNGVPSLRELGVPVDQPNYYNIYFPPNTPVDVRDKLVQRLKGYINDQEAENLYKNEFLIRAPQLTVQEYTTMHTSEVKKYKHLIELYRD